MKKLKPFLELGFVLVAGYAFVVVGALAFVPQ
jgi:hypothetical protein